MVPSTHRQDVHLSFQEGIKIRRAFLFFRSTWVIRRLSGNLRFQGNVHLQKVRGTSFLEGCSSPFCERHPERPFRSQTVLARILSIWLRPFDFSVTIYLLVLLSQRSSSTRSPRHPSDQQENGPTWMSTSTIHRNRWSGMEDFGLRNLFRPGVLKCV